jgi:hypothetical protein
VAEPGVAPLDTEALLLLLGRHRVEFVVIGGMGAVIHGDIGLTHDLDITPAGDRANLKRLAAALTEAKAKLRVPGARGGVETVEVTLSEQSFDAFTSATYRTRHGDLDVVLRPDGPGPTRSLEYRELAQRALTVRVFGTRVRVAALEDIIASKAAAGRPKDREALRRLQELQQRPSRRVDPQRSIERGQGPEGRGLGG